MSNDILEKYNSMVEKAIREEVEKSFGPKSPPQKACQYALMSGGKRVRPSIVLMVADALECKPLPTLAALTVEYFHTASLIADDLPCMDDDDERRNAPSLHIAFGEALSLLTTYSLIAEGYGNLYKNARLLEKPEPYRDRICALALENATYNTGLSGATGGQYLDISPRELSLKRVREVIHKKTSSLFELSFVLGWLYGGGDIDKLDLVKNGAYHYGQAFQIADDIDDSEQDIANGRSINVANLFGMEKALDLFEEASSLYRESIVKLKIDTPPLRAIVPEIKRSKIG